MSTVLSGQFPQLFAPGLRKTSFEAFTYRPTEHTSYLRVGSSKRQYEEDYRMGGFSNTVPVKNENESITYDAPTPGGKVRFTWTPRGKGFRVSFEAMEDELYGQLKKLSASLGRAFYNQIEVSAAALLSGPGAFTTPAGAGASNAGYDPANKTLFSTTHALLRGGAPAGHTDASPAGTTFRNRPGTDAALSQTALINALVDFERWVDESGMPVILPPKKLLYHFTQIPLVKELLGSQYKTKLELGTAGSANSDNQYTINVLQNELVGMPLHYLTSTTPWFVLASPEDTDLWITWRNKFMTQAADDFDTGGGKFKGYMRYGVGFGDVRGAWGTDGTP